MNQAIAPTSATKPVPCRGKYTATTYFVGRFNPVVDGHLLAVDSATVQDQLAARCPSRLAAYLGGDEEKLRLSQFKPVWFGPTVDQAEQGARWFRCDVVLSAVDNELADLPAPTKGALSAPDALDKFGICAGRKPGTPGFAHQVCSRPSSWQAVSTVDLNGAKYLEKSRQSAAETKCTTVAQERAGNSLTYTAAFEWPTRADWDAGQRFGFCWVKT